MLQDERAGADGALSLFQVAEVVHHFGGDDPHARRLRQYVEEPDVGLFQEELHGQAVHDLDPLDRGQEIAERIPRFCPEAVKGRLDILGHELASIEGRFVVPFHPRAQMEDVGRLVRRVPAFGEVGLHREGAWSHLRPHLVPHQRTVDEAQRRIRLEDVREMVIEVGRVKAAHTEDAAAPGLTSFPTPERRGARQGPGGQHDASSEASFEQRATIHPLGMWGTCLRYVHRYPSFSSRLARQRSTASPTGYLA